MTINLENNYYFEAYKKVENNITETGKLQYSYANITQEQFNSHYPVQGVKINGFTVIRNAFGSSVIDTIYHLAKAAFSYLKALFCSNENQVDFYKNEAKLNVYHAGRDLQKAYGNVCSIFNEKYGLYHIHCSEFNKALYNNLNSRINQTIHNSQSPQNISENNQNNFKPEINRDYAVKVERIIRNGDLTQFKMLLDIDGLDPDTVIYSGEEQTLLHRAIIHEQPKIIEELLNRLSPDQINAQDREGNTPVGLLTCVKDIETFEGGGRCHIRNEYYFDKNQLVQIGKLLIEKGADITIPNKNHRGLLPLYNAIIKCYDEQYLPFFELLIKHTKEMDNDKSECILYGALAFAVQHGHLKVINLLLDNGVDYAFVRRDNGCSLLHLAIINDDGDLNRGTMALLLKRCPDLHKVINKRNNKGLTPLHIAAMTTHIDLVRLLVLHGADPGILTPDNRNVKQLAQGFIDNISKKMRENSDNARGVMSYFWISNRIPDAKEIINFVEYYEIAGPKLSMLYKIKAKSNSLTEVTGFAILPPDLQNKILQLINTLVMSEYAARIK